MTLLRSLAERLLLAWRAAWLRARGATLATPERLGSNIVCRPGFETQKGRIVVGRAARIDHGVVLDAFGGRITPGAHVFLGPHTVIYGQGGVTIGDDCLIAMHCRILSSNHTIAPLGTLIRSQPDVLRPTTIGRDVWLGAGVTVLGGVTIGDGCVVGAGSVVTKDLPTGAIAFGAPAEVKSFREGASR